MLLREVLVEVACSFVAHAQISRHQEAASPLHKLAAGSASQKHTMSYFLIYSLPESLVAKLLGHSYTITSEGITINDRTRQENISLVSPLIVIIPVQPSFVELDNSLERITHKEMTPHRI